MMGIPQVLAGMPSLRLTDAGELRLQTMSFFLLAFLLSAGAVMGLWNWLRRDFNRLPRLTYPRSLAMVTLWGLLFVLVLTMISGARELMTPGAWEPRPGHLTYKLAGDGQPIVRPGADDRRAKLTALRDALWTYAATHNGQLPADPYGRELPADLWETSDVSRLRYIYVPGRKVGPAELIAYEPPVLPQPLGLFGDGTIRPVTDVDTASLKVGAR